MALKADEPAARPRSHDERDAGPVDVRHQIDVGPWSRQQKITLSWLVVLFIAEGIDGNLLGASIPAMASEWAIPSSSFSTPLFLSSLGAGAGVMIGGPVADRFGRQKPMILAALLFGLATAATALAQGITGLCIGRALAGLGLGLFLPAGLALVAELTPVRFRGRTTALALALTMVGIMLSSAMAGFLLERVGWRTLFVVGGLIPALWALLLFRFPESPEYLARYPDRRAELDRVMQRLGHPIDGRPLVVAERRERPSRWTILHRQWLGPTLWLCTAFFCLYLAISMILGWLPAMLVGEGVSLSNSNFAITAWSIGGLAGTLASGRLIERFGATFAARILTVGSLAGLGILAAVPLQGLDWFSLPFLVLMLEGGMTAGLVTSLYAAATGLFTSQARGTAIGLASAAGRGGMLVSAFLGAVAFELAGAQGFFGLAFAFLLAVVAATLFLPRAAQA